MYENKKWGSIRINVKHLLRRHKKQKNSSLEDAKQDYIMIRHGLTILKAFFKRAYLVEEEALNRVGKAKQGGIIDSFSD